MKILYFGADQQGTTSLHRASALERLGHRVIHCNPLDALGGLSSNRFADKFHIMTGHRVSSRIVARWVRRRLSALKSPVDVVWVDDGALFGRSTLARIRKMGAPVVLYSIDDPTGGRDGRKFDQLISSLPLYDLCVGMRESSVAEMASLGARKTLRVMMSYDEVEHRPPDKEEEIPGAFLSDIMFAGTWMRHEGRDIFLRTLFDAGLKISIWGGRWNLSSDTRLIRECWRGRALSGREYVHAIAGAKISIGLLSKGNRDEHTTRSQEIPYAGGLLCAERTSEHLALYEDGKEAVLWNDAEECAARCIELLKDEGKRASIRLGGMRRVRENRLGNEDVLKRILGELIPRG